MPMFTSPQIKAGSNEDLEESRIEGREGGKRGGGNDCSV